MKRILFLFLLLSTVSYGQEVAPNVANLTGKWQFSDIKSDKHSAEDIAERKALIDGTSITLNADGTCVTDLMMEVEGTWNVDTAKKTVTTTDRRGENVWHIHSLTKDKALLSRNQKDFKIEFVKN